MTEPTELDQLREDFPGWKITEHWVTVATGPDAYYLHAEGAHTDVNASTASEMASLLRQIDAHDVECVASDVLHHKPEDVFTVRRVLRCYRSGRMAPHVALAQLRGVR